MLTDELPDNPDPQWRSFLTSMLAGSVELCVWLCAVARQGARKRYRKTLHRRLENAAVAWLWFFDGQDCTLPLSSVCSDLDIDPDRVRARVLAACRPPADIKQIVEYILSSEGCCNAKRKRKNSGPRRMVATDWAGLRRYRRQYPFGASLEDFGRFAVGRQEDRDRPGRRGCGSPRGRAEDA